MKLIVQDHIPISRMKKLSGWNSAQEQEQFTFLLLMVTLKLKKIYLISSTGIQNRNPDDSLRKY